MKNSAKNEKLGNKTQFALVWEPLNWLFFEVKVKRMHDKKEKKMKLKYF